MNFNSKPKSADPDSLEDDPIPSYESWLNEGAEEIFSHWGFHIAKGAIELVKYLWTRERLLIELLIAKDVIQQQEVDEFFGDKAHEKCSQEGIKQLTRQLMRASSSGKLVSPKGKSIDPDTVLVMLNDVLDLNNIGWNGHTLEVLCETAGQRDLRAVYDEHVGLLKKINAQKQALRERKEQNERLVEERRASDRETRERKVRIYLSQCVVSDKPKPSEEDQKQMIEGNIPIPEVA